MVVATVRCHLAGGVASCCQVCKVDNRVLNNINRTLPKNGDCEVLKEFWEPVRDGEGGVGHCHSKLSLY